MTEYQMVREIETREQEETGGEFCEQMQAWFDLQVPTTFEFNNAEIMEG